MRSEGPFIYLHLSQSAEEVPPGQSCFRVQHADASGKVPVGFTLPGGGRQDDVLVDGVFSHVASVDQITEATIIPMCDRLLSGCETSLVAFVGGRGSTVFGPLPISATGRHDGFAVQAIEYLLRSLADLGEPLGSLRLGLTCFLADPTRPTDLLRNVRQQVPPEMEWSTEAIGGDQKFVFCASVASAVKAINAVLQAPSLVSFIPRLSFALTAAVRRRGKCCKLTLLEVRPEVASLLPPALAKGWRASSLHPFSKDVLLSASTCHPYDTVVVGQCSADARLAKNSDGGTEWKEAAAVMATLSVVVAERAERLTERSRSASPSRRVKSQSPRGGQPQQVQVDVHIYLPDELQGKESKGVTKEITREAASPEPLQLGPPPTQPAPRTPLPLSPQRASPRPSSPHSAVSIRGVVSPPPPPPPNPSQSPAYRPGRQEDIHGLPPPPPHQQATPFRSPRVMEPHSQHRYSEKMLSDRAYSTRSGYDSPAHRRPPQRTDQTPPSRMLSDHSARHDPRSGGPIPQRTPDGMAQLHDAESRAERATSRVRELEQELHRMASDRRQAREESQAASDELRRMRAELVETGAAMQRRHEHGSAQASEIQRLKAALSEAEERARDSENRLQLEVSSLQNDLKGAQKSLAEVEAKHLDAIRQRVQQVGEVEEKAASLAAELDEATQSLHRATKETERLQELSESLQEKLSTATEEAAASAKRVREVEEANQRLLEEADRARKLAEQCEVTVSVEKKYSLAVMEERARSRIEAEQLGEYAALAMAEHRTRSSVWHYERMQREEELLGELERIRAESEASASTAREAQSALRAKEGALTMAAAAHEAEIADFQDQLEAITAERDRRAQSAQAHAEEVETLSARLREEQEKLHRCELQLVEEEAKRREAERERDDECRRREREAAETDPTLQEVRKQLFEVETKLAAAEQASQRSAAAEKKAIETLDEVQSQLAAERAAHGRLQAEVEILKETQSDKMNEMLEQRLREAEQYAAEVEERCQQLEAERNEINQGAPARGAAAVEQVDRDEGAPRTIILEELATSVAQELHDRDQGEWGEEREGLLRQLRVAEARRAEAEQRLMETATIPSQGDEAAAALQEEIARLRSEIDTRDTVILTLKDKCNAAVKARAEAEKRERQLLRKGSSADGSAASSASSAPSSPAARKVNESEVIRLKAEVSQLQQRLAASDADTSELAKLRGEVAALQQRAAMAADEVAEERRSAASAVSDAQADTMMLKAEVANKNREIAVLRQEAAATHQEQQSLASNYEYRMQVVQEQHTAAINAWRSREQEWVARHKALEEQVVASAEAIRRMEAARNEAEARAIKAEEAAWQHEDLRQKDEELRQRERFASMYAKTSAGQITSYKEKIRELESERQDLFDRVSELEASNEAALEAERRIREDSKRREELLLNQIRSLVTQGKPSRSGSAFTRVESLSGDHRRLSPRRRDGSVADSQRSPLRQPTPQQHAVTNVSAWREAAGRIAAGHLPTSPTSPGGSSSDEGDDEAAALKAQLAQIEAQNNALRQTREEERRKAQSTGSYRHLTDLQRKQAVEALQHDMSELSRKMERSLSGKRSAAMSPRTQPPSPGDRKSWRMSPDCGTTLSSSHVFESQVDHQLQRLR
eukprot:Sspe_Gene.9921::Locus_3333_Transcript_6_7_Confidence_0.250_Length_5273::g.9921::m.9921